jgi:RNA polymerase sigma-70 factor, ECF subfamily
MDLFSFDDDYVRRLRAGDRETEEHFYRYFRDLLKAKLRRTLHSPQAREEVLQEVFLRVLQRLEQLKDGRKLGAFFNTTCNHVLQEHYRQETRTVPLDEKWDIAAAGPHPDDELDRKDAADCVREVLATLTPRDAEILRLIFLEEENKDAISTRLGVEPSYLRVLLLRAKAKFRAAWKRRKKRPPKR